MWNILSCYDRMIPRNQEVPCRYPVRNWLSWLKSFLVSVCLSVCQSAKSLAIYHSEYVQLFISASVGFNINTNHNFGFIWNISCIGSLTYYLFPRTIFDSMRWLKGNMEFILFLKTWAPEKYNSFMDSCFQHCTHCLAGGHVFRFCA
jgi:hypothetical protein